MFRSVFQGGLALPLLQDMHRVGVFVDRRMFMLVVAPDGGVVVAVLQFLIAVRTLPAAASTMQR